MSLCFWFTVLIFYMHMLCNQITIHFLTFHSVLFPIMEYQPHPALVLFFDVKRLHLNDSVHQTNQTESRIISKHTFDRIKNMNLILNN